MPLPPFPIPFRVMRTGLGFHRRVLDLADALVPAEAALWDHVAGIQRTMLSGVLVDSGLADALGTARRDPAALAAELGLDPVVTFRVLRAAGAARLVDLDTSGQARLTRLGGPLRVGHPRSIAAWVGYVAASQNVRAYEQLGQQLRSGAEPSGHRRAFGNSVWEYLGEHTEEGARFGEAMRNLTEVDVQAIARAYPWPRRGVVCDVAGGTGTLLAAILARRPRARGVLIDAPEVLADSESLLATRGVADRVERRSGDLFGELDARADVYVLKWILHDWSDEACHGILRRLRATMPPGSRVVVIDQHQEPNRASPITSMVDLQMLVVCEGGRERSPEEVHGLMRAAGLKPGRVRHAGFHMLVEGRAG